MRKLLIAVSTLALLGGLSGNALGEIRINGQYIAGSPVDLSAPLVNVLNSTNLENQTLIDNSLVSSSTGPGGGASYGSWTTVYDGATSGTDIFIGQPGGGAISINNNTLPVDATSL